MALWRDILKEKITEYRLAKNNVLSLPDWPKTNVYSTVWNILNLN
jgi:hypothetical protein